MNSWVMRWVRTGVTLVAFAGVGLSAGGTVVPGGNGRRRLRANGGLRRRRSRCCHGCSCIRLLMLARCRRSLKGDGQRQRGQGPGRRTSRSPGQGGWCRAGSLPVFAESAGLAATAVQGAQVRLLGQTQARKLGLAGVVFEVAAPTSGLLSVGLRYAKFATRSAVTSPTGCTWCGCRACALTTPGKAQCRVQTPVESQLRPRRDPGISCPVAWLSRAGGRERARSPAGGAAGRAGGGDGRRLRRLRQQR